MKYERPNLKIVEADAELLTSSEIVGSGPGATSIGSPSVSNECKSVWDEVNEKYNIKEEQNYEEDWI